jgi:hypothetical protein
MGTGAFFASDEEENDWAEGGRLLGLLTRLEELEGEASGEEEVGERGLAFRSLWVPSFFFFELFFLEASPDGMLASLA